MISFKGLAASMLTLNALTKKSSVFSVNALILRDSDSLLPKNARLLLAACCMILIVLNLSLAVTHSRFGSSYSRVHTLKSQDSI